MSVTKLRRLKKHRCGDIAKMRESASKIMVARRLSCAIIVLAAIAAGVGLLTPTVYGETAWVVPQNRGQDLVTLLALAALVPALIAVRRGSPRATLIWLGLLGYVAYTYTGAAFAHGFNALFPAYVALFSLAGSALIAGLSGIDEDQFWTAFDARTPRRGVMAFLVIMAFILCLLWSSQIIPFYTRGELPNMIVQAKTPTVFVYVIDLGVVVPLALLSAWWLKRDRPWGYALAGIVLVKAATMGLALLSMTGFALRTGLDVEAVTSLAWVALAAAGLFMSVWYFSHCSNERTVR